MKRCAAILVAALAVMLPLTAPAQRVSPHGELSLVVARTTRIGGIVPLEFDTGCGDEPCPEIWPLGSFERAETLSGKPVPNQFTAEMRGWGAYVGPPRKYLPALLLVEWQHDGSYHVLAHAFSEGSACLDREFLALLDWHPKGRGIMQRDGAVCADLRRFAQ